MRALCVAVALLLAASSSAEDKLLVKCGTTKGDITIELFPAWSPNGVSRFVDLVEDGFFDGSAFFRCVNNFLVQFGVAADPEKSSKWRGKGNIDDDPRRPELGEGVGGPGGVFPKGGVSFAGNGKDSRTTQLFITFRDGVVGKMPWENQIGQIVEGIENVDNFYTGYGDMEMFNKGGVNPQKLEMEGISYVKENFPKLDLFQKCTVSSTSSEWEELKKAPKKTTAKFVNKSGKDVHLFWEHPEEKSLHAQGILKDGESAVQGTWTGHRFVLKAGEDEGASVLATAAITADKEYVYDGKSEEL